MPIDPNLVSTITVPQLASLGLTADTLVPHQVVGGKLKKATLAVFTAYFQANLTLVAKTIISKNEFDVLEDGVGSGNWYIEFKDEAGAALGATIRPYSVEAKVGTKTYPIPALLENDDAWSFPRIYGFQSSGTTQAIKVYVI